MVSDPYAASAALVTQLRESGLSVWAQKIEDIVQGGSTATEILMGLRWTLRELLHVPTLSPEVAGVASAILESVDQLLR